jgi:LysM repeat protein
MKSRLLIALILTTLLLGGFPFAEDAHACDTVSHIVRPGESVSRIAGYYGVSVSAIVQANNLWNPNVIYPGQCLVIPICGGQAPGCVTIHVVKRGEYLKAIAVRYGTTVSAIVQLNGLGNPNLIYSGQRLKIPCTTPPPPPPPPPKPGCVNIHVVKRGEYLKTIAARYGVSVTAIVRLNGIRNPNLIYPGQRLKIPCKTPPPEPTPPPSAGPWRGQYWGNRFLSGNPKFVRNSQTVNFNWSTQGPGGGIGGTDFSVRWNRTRSFDPGRYRFNVVTDDGVRVWVDGILIIDEWHDTAPRHYIADRELSAGNHTLQIDYYQNTGGAQIRFWTDRLDAPTAWTGRYFNNTSLQGPPVVTRHYPTIDFEWGRNAPAPGVTADYYSARYVGEFHFAGGGYRFFVTVDDGARLYLDDQLILDAWHIGATRTYTVDRDVSAGNHRIKVEYFENNGGAVLKVRWTQR